jgi:Holliday junction resolvase-like predicted endonuclease
MRKDSSFGEPQESVTYSKKTKIINAALDYIYRYQLDNFEFRFDVLAVNCNNTNNPKINHIKSAFNYGKE